MFTMALKLNNYCLIYLSSATNVVGRTNSLRTLRSFQSPAAAPVSSKYSFKLVCFATLGSFWLRRKYDSLFR